VTQRKVPGKWKGLFRDADGTSYLYTFLLISSLFLLWGFCSGLLDNLNKHFQNSLHLTRFQSGFVQNAFYMGYFLMALPAGWVAKHFGYKSGIILGLTLAGTGAFWFIPATNIDTYWAFLAGLFVLASGLACLETVANPYTTVLGSPQGGATRINMAQMCNGFGWTSGMFVGAHIILSANEKINTSNGKLYIPYLCIGLTVILLLLVFIFTKLPDLRAVEDMAIDSNSACSRSIFSRRHFMWGVFAEFLYVAAQTGIFSFFINYSVANISGLSDRGAGNLQTIAFALFASGRLIGSAVVGFTKPHLALAIYAAINVGLMGTAMFGGGKAGVAAVMASFFFMSIMFPTIFALSIHGLGEHTKLGSSALVMSIVGGAIMTPVMGFVADVAGMRTGFVIPLVCFVAVATYGARWQKLETAVS
jgi:FHS family L-fucose permease-like MFS transporter